MPTVAKKPARYQRRTKNDRMAGRDPELVAYGEAVAFARRKRRLNQKEFAPLVGVSHTTLSNVEIGNYWPSSEVDAALRRVLGLAEHPHFVQK